MARDKDVRRSLWVVIAVTCSVMVGAAVGAGVFFALRSYDIPSEPEPRPSSRLRTATAADLLYVFDRPAEPIFSHRGVDRKLAFVVPVSYLPERYRRDAAEVARQASRDDDVVLVAVEDLAMPSARFADVNAMLPFRSPYTRSAPPLLALAVRFWHFFRESKSVTELLARAVWARLHFNPEMILDALMLTMLRSTLPGVQDVPLPELTQYYPELYVDDEFFAKTREEMHSMPINNRVPVAVDRDLQRDDEAALWYFREDAHFHVFHWKWHVVYPAGTDDAEYVDLPRRGEMFVQLHRQFTARYNAERFTNGLPAVLPMDVHVALPKGYFPKMVHLHGSKGTIGRPDNSSLVLLTTFVQGHDQQVALYEKVLKQGYVIYANGTRVDVKGIEGLDIISNLLEGNTVMSPDYAKYGNVHNDLHKNLPKAHDPLQHHNEPFSVTSYITTVAKDPAFYNIHMLMDNLYEKYKRQLPAYSKTDMTPLPRVTVQSVSAQTEGLVQSNELRTHWQLSDLDVSMGLDYMPTGKAYARFTHLQHRRFHWLLQVTNNEAKARRVFVRVFLLVEVDEKGSKLDLDFQRRFSLQMDTFDTLLAPGANTVRRESTASALTVDTDAIYSTQATKATAAEVRRRNHCRCGWPLGLLLPRGTEAGTHYKLFAMVTDYEQDKAPVSDAEVCHDGWILCGVPGSTHYPDVRPMGFPLDRPYRPDVRKLDDFLTPNMAVADVVIKFENVTDSPSDLLPGGISTSWLPTGEPERARQLLEEIVDRDFMVSSDLSELRPLLAEMSDF